MMCNQGQIKRTVGFSRFPQPKKSAIQTTMTCSYSTYNYLLPIYSSISCNFYCVLHSIWMSPFYCIFHKFLLSFQTILVPSDFDNGIWISTSTFLIASLVNLSDHSLPTIPIWARVHIINIFFFHTIYDEQKELHTEFAGGYLCFHFQCLTMLTMNHYKLLFLKFYCLPPILKPNNIVHNSTAYIFQNDNCHTSCFSFWIFQSICK